MQNRQKSCLGCPIQQKKRVCFPACGGVLEHGAVLLHKSVQKVLTHVLQPVHDQANGMKYVFIF